MIIRSTLHLVPSLTSVMQIFWLELQVPEIMDETSVFTQLLFMWMQMLTLKL